MKTTITALTRLIRDERGTEATSIALGIVLIALTAGLGMVILGNNLGQFFFDVGTSVGNATPGSIPTPTPPS